ncbi:hypothetical protein Kpol_1062p20 [Vanderwaltozyma polyspora DSM 70294]|uniref:YTH domain-containing protein n=1 Tax=Vanderwaltozyma polyspora (strain ATCC 22028 / DSM 70294 / BCRC 21397 / CBS 2163 / NBRC 10782 / NRRL Y-8283 / UCD 57-17) TaxID=436907 RepID=A7TK77_VANPO|nr:uncharacterized protein Kpol_1062p20 [Vanderwaltozyma polyspora DSM 70294]EDO17312.1 hypothetical protein Kpol_1062p20 [Vanderwaltozyma polyspora DSM 70294]
MQSVGYSVRTIEDSLRELEGLIGSGSGRSCSRDSSLFDVFLGGSASSFSGASHDHDFAAAAGAGAATENGPLSTAATACMASAAIHNYERNRNRLDLGGSDSSVPMSMPAPMTMSLQTQTQIQMPVSTPMSLSNSSCNYVITGGYTKNNINITTNTNTNTNNTNHLAIVDDTNNNIGTSVPSPALCVNNLSRRPRRRSSMAIVPRWVDVPENSRFFVIKSSRLDHVQKSFYNGIWSSTYFGNKRLSEAFSSLDPGTKLFLLFSVNASGRFCGVAEMVSNLEDELDTSIWDDTSRKFGKAFKVRWVLVRDVHNRSLKHFLIPDNDMKPVTNSRDTQEIPFSIGNSILKLFRADPAAAQSFLDSDYV